MWKPETLKGNMLALSSGDLGKWALEAVRLPRCDLWTPSLCARLLTNCVQLWMSYDRISQDTLFWLVASQKAAAAVALQTSNESLLLRAAVWEPRRGENRWRWDSEAFWQGLSPFFAISKALLCCFENVNYLLGSAARGRSSCNNTEIIKRLWPSSFSGMGTCWLTEGCASRTWQREGNACGMMSEHARICHPSTRTTEPSYLLYCCRWHDTSFRPLQTAAGAVRYFSDGWLSYTHLSPRRDLRSELMVATSEIWRIFSPNER